LVVVTGSGGFFGAQEGPPTRTQKARAFPGALWLLPRGRRRNPVALAQKRHVPI